MTTFAPDSFGYPVAEPVLDAFRTVWTALAQPGRWWTGPERVAIADVARGAEPRHLGNPYPPIDQLGAEDDGDLSPLVRTIVERVTTESFRLDRPWFDRVVARLDDRYGPRAEGRYAELVAIVAQVAPIDHLCRVVGRPLEPLPVPQPGEPSQAWPDDLVDGGAWLPMSGPEWGPNVARGLGPVPEDNLLRLGLVMAMYGGVDDLARPVWDHRALARPQVELLAARTSALNECFY